MNGNLLDGMPYARRLGGRRRARGRLVSGLFRLICLGVALTAIGAAGVEAVRVTRRVWAGEITAGAYLRERLGGLWWVDGDGDATREPPSDTPTPDGETTPESGGEEERQKAYEALYAYDAAAVPAGARAVIPVDAYAEGYSWGGEFQAPWAGEGEDGPRVLIVHSHAGEGYTAAAPYLDCEASLGRADGAREASVVGVGEALTKALNEGGLGALHIDERFDAVGNAGAFERAADRVGKMLAQQGSVRLVVDVHRASGMDASGNLWRQVTLWDGQPTAQMSILYAAGDQTSKEAAQALAHALNEGGEHLCGAPTATRMEGWAQEGVCMLRIEVGTAGNRPEEAANAARALASALLRMP